MMVLKVLSGELQMSGLGFGAEGGFSIQSDYVPPCTEY
jgi:hypothetical protein